MANECVQRMFSELSDCVYEVHLEIYEGTMFCPTKWDCFSSGACLKLCEARVPVKPCALPRVQHLRTQVRDEVLVEVLVVSEVPCYHMNA